MRVWVVTRVEDISGEVAGVFTSQLLAEKFIAARMRPEKYWNPFTYRAEEWEVDECDAHLGEKKLMRVREHSASRRAVTSASPATQAPV